MFYIQMFGHLWVKKIKKDEKDKDFLMDLLLIVI